MMSWIVHTLVSATLLMLVVLALRRPVAQAFGARVAYALWLLPALRMILPPLPGHAALFVPALEIDPAGPIRVGLAATDLPVAPPVLPPIDAVPQAAAWSWSMVLLVAWLGGTVLWFGWQMLRYRRFVTRALHGAAPLGRECGVEILVSDHVEGPVASGVLRRRIFLPRDFVARYSSPERRQALLHEGAHHDRHDLLANVAGLLVLAFHWWNPIAHIAHRAFRSDQELACDATVLAGADAGARYAYGSALVKSACAHIPAAACALDPATEIKRRLRMIGRDRLPASLRAAGAALAISAIGAGLFATASSGSPAPAAAPAMALPASPALPAAPALPTAPAIVAADGEADGVASTHRPAREIRRAALAARTDVARARIEADRARAAGERARMEGERAARQAMVEGERARAEGDRARAEGERARRPAMIAVEAAAFRRDPLDRTRASMVVACAVRGRPVSPDERDWSELALCGKAAFHAELRRRISTVRMAFGRPPSSPPAPPAPPAPPHFDPVLR